MHNFHLQERRFALLLERLPQADQITVQKAYDHAKRSHEGQLRDGGSPYIIHPLRVAMLLLEIGETDVSVISAALLHDTVEDCDDTVEGIQEQFGEKIAHLVQDLTRERSPDETEAMKKVAKPHKFRWYLTEACVDACKIKSADVIDNMRSWQFIPTDHPTKNKFPRWCNDADMFYEPLTKKAGPEYFELFRDLAIEYQNMPQFHDYLKKSYE